MNTNGNANVGNVNSTGNVNNNNVNNTNGVRPVASHNNNYYNANFITCICYGKRRLIKIIAKQV